MDKIKPYLFWIICGAILLVELILIAVIEPVNEDKKDVYTKFRGDIVVELIEYLEGDYEEE